MCQNIIKNKIGVKMATILFESWTNAKIGNFLKIRLL